jgi:hypothetical protein
MQTNGIFDTSWRASTARKVVWHLPDNQPLEYFRWGHCRLILRIPTQRLISRCSASCNAVLPSVHPSRADDISRPDCCNVSCGCQAGVSFVEVKSRSLCHASGRSNGRAMVDQLSLRSIAPLSSNRPPSQHHPIYGKCSAVCPLVVDALISCPLSISMLTSSSLPRLTAFPLCRIPQPLQK